MKSQNKPVVKLIGKDGNAFAIIGECRRAARKAGFTSEEISDIVSEMTSGDYNHLLVTAMTYFKVE